MDIATWKQAEDVIAVMSINEDEQAVSLTRLCRVK